MLLLTLFSLAVALALTLLQLRRHRRDLRTLAESVLNRQPYLQEKATLPRTASWDRLIGLVNAVVIESNQLHRQQSSQLTHLEATLGSLQEAVLIVDSRNNILLANAALKRIFPRTKQILNQRIETVLPGSDFLSYMEAVRAGQAQPQKEIEFAGLSTSTWLEATGSLIPPLEGQTGSWALFVLHDITRQKRLEGIRKDFVANVSHELRTPLSVIKGYVETLAGEEPGIDPADRSRFLAIIQRHTDRLGSLVEDLLVLSELESKAPDLRTESVDLPRFTSAWLEDFRTRDSAEEHDFRLSFPAELPPAQADPDRLSQVLENLVGNAVKYTPPGSVIEIGGRMEAGELIGWVRDNGPGIPPGDLPHIFERFYRVDKSRSRQKGGTGLGLSIVKHIVQLHGGRTWAESHPGEGAAFFFSLPQ